MGTVACVLQVMGTVACVFLEMGTGVYLLVICVEEVICDAEEMVIS